MPAGRPGWPNSRGAMLLAVYDQLLSRYGPQHWWPAESPLEMIVGAILTQSAAWSNVEKAIANLKREGTLSLQALRRIRQEELGRLVYASGYYNSKARKLKAFAEWVAENQDDDLSALFSLDTGEMRRQLLSVHGIGEETADSIILYAAHKPIFVIDAYTRRIVTRLGLTPAGKGYSDFQSLFMQQLPHDEQMFNEYHALLVKHGKDICRRTPLCDSCCLAPHCQLTGKHSDNI
jgi:endonuclease III related protein